jgi:hypothetical protein
MARGGSRQQLGGVMADPRRGKGNPQDPQDILIEAHPRQQSTTPETEPWEQPIEEKGGGIVYRNEVHCDAGVYYTSEPCPDLDIADEEGLLHRADGPAWEGSDGSKQWFLNGKRHREDGPALEMADGQREWWLNGELHREDGPAVEDADGTKRWFLNGDYHREDGPSVELPDGTEEWYLYGEELTEDEWKTRTSP